MLISNIKKDIVCLGIIGLLVAALIVFFAIYGPIVGISFTPNFNWTQAFSTQFLNGELYPRWLHQSYQGAGSPAFYFYGPMPFWIGTVATSILCPDCSPEVSFMIGPCFILGLSSISCYYFVRTFSNRIIALLSSVLYLFLPYHFIIDFWLRNSWGELSSYIFMPLVLLSIKYSANSSRFPVAAALSYAGLLFSHLPSTLLFSPIMLLYSCLAYGIKTGIQNTILIVLLGSGVAAIYIVPALTTQHLINYEFWANFDPTDWLWISGKYSLTRGKLCLIVVAYSLLLVWVNSALFTIREIKQENLLLLALLSSLYCFFIMTDLSILLWEHINLLRKVQFPWRATIIVDLSVVIIFALTLVRQAQYRLKRLTYTSIIIVYLIGIFLLFSQYLPEFLLTSKDKPLDELVLSGFEPAEYRTKWFVTDHPDMDYREMEESLKNIPQMVIISGSGGLSSIREMNDVLTAQVTAETVIRLLFRRFYYPGWDLIIPEKGNENISVELSSRYALIEATLPAGNYSVILARGSIPEQSIAEVITIISLFLCGLLLFWNRIPPALTVKTP